MSKLADSSGFGVDNLSLVWALRETHIRRGVVKEQESWRVMDNLFKSINKATRTEEQPKAYSEPMYNSVSHVATERINGGESGQVPPAKDCLVKHVMVVILGPTITLILAVHMHYQ